MHMVNGITNSPDETQLARLIAELGASDIHHVQQVQQTLITLHALAVPALVKAMLSGSGKIAEEAAVTLTSIHLPEVTAALVEALSSTNTRLGVLAVNALAKRSCLEMVEALPFSKPRRQLYILRMLEDMGDRRCILPLLEFLQQTHTHDVRDAVLQAVKAIHTRPNFYRRSL